MNSHREFSQKLSSVSRLLAAEDYDAALKLVDSIRSAWPGNAQLDVLWARLVQSQEQPSHDLADAKAALQQAVALDKGSPAAAIELGYFLDNVEDDPKGASRVFAEAIESARKLLLDGLIGQAKALRQLPKRDEYLQCLAEIIQLARFENRRTGGKGKSAASDVQVVSPKNGVRLAVQLKGPHAQEIGELLNDFVASEPIFVSR